MSTARAEAGAFVVWITGLPASGKSAITARLVHLLGNARIQATVLESDKLREAFSDQSTYDERDRKTFYSAIAFMAEILAGRGVPVIIDATANRREYRERARMRIPRFIEVYVACPLEVCMARDPKGLYRRALNDPQNQMPGLGAAYESPVDPEVVVHGDYEPPESGAQRVMDALRARGYL